MFVVNAKILNSYHIPHYYSIIIPSLLRYYDRILSNLKASCWFLSPHINVSQSCCYRPKKWMSLLCNLINAALMTPTSWLKCLYTKGQKCSTLCDPQHIIPPSETHQVKAAAGERVSTKTAVKQKVSIPNRIKRVNIL